MRPQEVTAHLFPWEGGHTQQKMERNDQARRPGHVVGHTGGGGDSDAVRSGCRFLARPLFAFFGPRGGVTRGPITSPPNQRAEELATRTQVRGVTPRAEL